MRLEQDAIDTLVGLKHSGYSSRLIAEVLGCSKSTVNNYIARLGNTVPKRLPKILLFDLESAPSLAAVFGRFKVNVGSESIIREGGFLLSACYKFLGDRDIKGIKLTSKEAIAGDDSRIVAELYEAFEQADIVVAHNADRFDVPLFKTRLLANGMTPPKKVKVIDTLKIARGLKFNSNKLDSLGNYLQVGRKIETVGMSLWIRCMQGDKKALEEMLTYNRQDVVLLEQVYLQLRAFDERLPSVAHYHEGDDVRCPCCGSTDIEETGNSVYTQVSEFKEMQCNGCGHRSRTRIAINSKDKRKGLLL